MAYLKIARAVASDELYRMIFSIISCTNNLLELFTEDEVVRLCSVSAYSSDRKLEMISVWADSNKEIFKKADSIRDAFVCFLRHFDEAHLSYSAISSFLRGESVFPMNPDCRHSTVKLRFY